MVVGGTGGIFLVRIRLRYRPFNTGFAVGTPSPFAVAEHRNNAPDTSEERYVNSREWSAERRYWTRARLNVLNP